MDQITARALRAAEWKPVYTYTSERTPFSFVIYVCDALPGLTITKERRGNKRVRTNTIYQFQGRKTDSPTQIVRYWNEAARKQKQSGRPPAGSAEQVRRARGRPGL